MDTITKDCKKCEEEFDSIPELDNGICDDCKDTCKGCGVLFPKDELLAKGDELYCTGCLETDDGEKGEQEVCQ